MAYWAVPLLHFCAPGTDVDRMASPGAARSTHVPWFELGLLLSSLSSAATASTFGQSAGATRFELPLLPAPATTTTFARHAAAIASRSSSTPASKMSPPQGLQSRFSNARLMLITRTPTPTAQSMPAVTIDALPAPSSGATFAFTSTLS